MNRSEWGPAGDASDRDHRQENSADRHPTDNDQLTPEILDGLQLGLMSPDELADQSAPATRLRNLDQVISNKMTAGSVPEGLADRLKQQAREVAGSDSSHGGQVVTRADSDRAHAESEARTQYRSPSRGKKPSSRKRRSAVKWLAASCAGILILAVAGVGIGMLIWPRAEPPVSRQSISHDVMKWVRMLDNSQWQAITENQLPDYPLAPDVLPKPRHWIKFPTDYDDRSIVYDLTPAGGKRVLQFTIRSSREFELATFLPLTPIYQTGQFCIGACYRDGILYVLFVEGDAHRYRQMIEKRLGPV